MDVSGLIAILGDEAASTSFFTFLAASTVGRCTMSVKINQCQAKPNAPCGRF